MNHNTEDCQCPICFNIPPKEVFQSVNGHILCHTCSPSLQTCPQCNKKCPRTYSYLEKVPMEQFLNGYEVKRMVLPSVGDMKYWVLMALVITFLRKLVERGILEPLGLFLGISPSARPKPLPYRNTKAIPVLEQFYQQSKSSKRLSVNANGICQLVKTTQLEEKEIQRWLRRRRKMDRPSKLTKFTESGWRLLCYVISSILGVYTLWDKNWWNAAICWENYPNHEVLPETRLYYTYGAGFYLSLLLTQAFDVKRKDFWEMFLHHVSTLSLMSLSWKMNAVRIGVQILFLHDCADVFLEAAKLANYSKRENLATGIFICFTVVWVVTRLYFYPVVFIWEHGNVYSLMMPSYWPYLFIGLTSALFGLHVFWTYFICKTVVVVMNPGDLKQKDSRSSTECSGESHSD